MRRRDRALLRAGAGLALLVACVATPAVAQEDEPVAPDSTESGPGIRIGHGSKGFEIETADGRFLIQIQPRLQLRFSTPFDSDPVSAAGLADPNEVSLAVRRARLKVGGHAFEPWLGYYFEYELSGSVLLNFEATLEKWEALGLRVGQWKVAYNRERMISSGKQQLADRSHLTYPFTIDRQQGVSLFGRLRAGGAADVSYAVGVFTGTGRGGNRNDDDVPMWTGRLQWNPMGEPVPMEGSDLNRRSDPVAGIALAASTNRSPYTRFSQSGGGQLPGFEEGAAGQYRIRQAVLETSFMWRGVSWQQELHWKEIDDRASGRTTELVGNYVQAGLFPRQVLSFVPAPLELAVRHAVYDPDRSVGDDLERELSLAANWFFAGHANKLTAEVSRLSFDAGGPAAGETRFRLQWDVSF